MTRLGLASAVVACLPVGVMEQIMEIWEGKTSCHVDMEFQVGRCMEMKVTTAMRYKNEDFKESIDNVAPSI